MCWLALSVCVLVWGAGCAQQYLLPGDVRPRSYELRLLYDVDPATNFPYYGAVDILLTATKLVSSITLHAQGYSIPEGGVELRGPRAPDVTKFHLNETWAFLTLKLSRPLQAKANYTLTVRFYGNLKSELNGVYVSNYVDKATGIKEYLITTQFEPIKARKGFPCFDEPIYKATFRIHIGHHSDYTAISNMPVHNSTNENLLEKYWPWSQVRERFKKQKTHFVWDTFKESVPMSTYLVAFVVSKFAYVESPAGLSDKSFKIWCQKDATQQAEYAATVGPKVLSHFEKFFNVSFPLPKQDMIAIPDFAAGAMENWGLITYKETSLLYDKKESSLTNKERVAKIIAHELAHQWFGNLVTMKWWNDLWLNEGFATYMAFIGASAVEPNWQILVDMNAVDNILIIQSLDSMESSHPVSAVIENPNLIDEIFDKISYNKGATLIRMMVILLGEDVFRRAMHDYLVKHSYSNAEQDDLWSELTATSQQYSSLTRNISLKQVMDSWTTQTGYPLLTVTRDYSDSSVSVEQKRYLNAGARTSTEVSWWIPLTVMCESEVGKGPEPIQWLASHEGVKKPQRFEHGANAMEWILFNYNMIAPYRVNYDSRNWQLLTATLASEQYQKVPQLARVQLLSDAFALAWSEQLDYGTALQLGKYLQHESEYLPINAGLAALGQIETLIKRMPEYGAYQKFVRQLIGKQYKQSGGLATKRILRSDDISSVKLQALLSDVACRVKVAGCEEHAVELFQEWMLEADPDTSNPIPLDLRGTVYCVGVARGSVREWRFMLERKQRANVASVEELTMSALTCTREIWILKQYLEWCVSESGEVRRQDAARVLCTVASSSVGYYVAKDFVYNRIGDIYKTLGSHGRGLGALFKTLLGQFTTQLELDEYLAWQEKNMKYLGNAKHSISQGIEASKVNIQWLSRNGKLVVEKMREITAPGPKSRYAEKLKFKIGRTNGTQSTPIYKLIIMFVCIITVI